MEYTDFRVSASCIAALLGAFGGHSRFQTLCSLWEKSTFKETYNEFKRDGQQYWESDRQHIRLLGVSDQWKQLGDYASMATVKSDIQFVHDTAYRTLFQSQYLLKKAEQAIAVLNSPGVVAIIQRIFSGPQDYYAALKDLQCKRSELGLDQIQQFIELVEHSSKLCYGITSRCTRAYGVHGESQFIEKHNSEYAIPIQRDDRLHSKTIEKGVFSWCIDGRIDGLKNNTIVEIKHRRAELFEEVPIYELVQLHAYMFLLEKQQAIWFQCSQATGWHMSEKRVVQYCPIFWQLILDHIRLSLQFIYHLHADPISRRAFFLLTDDARDKLMGTFMGSLETGKC